MNYRNEIWLRQKYINKKKSITYIAKECNCSTATIHKYLKKYNIKTRNKSEGVKLNLPSTSFKKGNIPWIKGKKMPPSWNKGLTKETDERLKKLSDKFIGRPGTNKGRKFSEEWKKKISIANSFEKNYMWKGDLADDNSKHTTVRKIKKKPLICGICNEIKKLELSFIHHPKPYTRDPNDYIYLCRSCHTFYDYQIGYRKK